MTLTEEVKIGIYKASMEPGLRDAENQLFTKIDETAFSTPTGFDNPSDPANARVSMVNNTLSADRRVGPGVLLKVMAGDKFKASVLGWYKVGNTDMQQLAGAGSIVSGLADILNTAIGGVGKVTSGALASNGALNVPLTDLLNNRTTPASNQPKAYLSWMVLDEEQFKAVSGNCGAALVPVLGANDARQLMQANNGNYITVNKNGYLYVYVSNESKGEVYFDDLTVEHVAGPLVDETHYYPFGLTMAGISSKAAGGIENKKKFNDGSELEHGEFSNGDGLELYSTDFRNYDCQLGRFIQQDPIGDYFESMSGYVFANNNPALLNDPLGLAATDWIKKADGEVIFDKEINSQDEALAKYGPKAEYLGKETNLYDPKSETQVHGNADGTTSAITNETVVVKSTPKEKKGFTEQDARVGLQEVNKNFGKEMASIVERMYRVETNHFTSKQYRNTGTGGMEVHGAAPYYGWTPSYFTQAPVGIYSIFENKGMSGQGGNAQVTSRPKQFVIMPSVTAAMMFKANYIQGHDGNYARWYSTNPQSQALYRQQLQAVVPKIVNSFK